MAIARGRSQNEGIYQCILLSKILLSSTLELRVYCPANQVNYAKEMENSGPQVINCVFMSGQCRNGIVDAVVG